MSLSFGWGITFALLSLCFNGSFSSLNKLPRVVESKINPQIFNIYFSLGVIIMSVIVYIILLLLGEDVDFTYLGILSGLLLAFAGIFTFAAISKIGLSVGISIWSGTAILISFLEGVLTSDTNNVGIAILGVIILVFGIIGVAFSEATAQYLCFTNKEMEDIANNNNNNNNTPLTSADGAQVSNLSQQLVTDDIQQQSSQAQDTSQLSQGTKSYHTYQSNIKDIESNTLPISSNGLSSRQQQHQQRRNSVTSHYDEFNEELDISRWFLGIFYAMLTGIFGGSVGFPSTFTDGTDSGKAKFLISFAVGVAIIFPITMIYQCFVRSGNERIEWHYKESLIPGIFSGILWNLGNLCSLYAIDSLSYAVAYPIMQSSLVVGVIWGIFVWKEFTDRRVIGTIFFFSLVVVIGCTTITIGVQGGI